MTTLNFSKNCILLNAISFSKNIHFFFLLINIKKLLSHFAKRLKNDRLHHLKWKKSWVEYDHLSWCILDLYFFLIYQLLFSLKIYSVIHIKIISFKKYIHKIVCNSRKKMFWWVHECNNVDKTYFDSAGLRYYILHFKFITHHMNWLYDRQNGFIWFCANSLLIEI